MNGCCQSKNYAGLLIDSAIPPKSKKIRLCNAIERLSRAESTIIYFGCYQKTKVLLATKLKAFASCLNKREHKTAY